jgi:ribosomal protein S18 acetylase RimI-like enzyme
MPLRIEPVRTPRDLRAFAVYPWSLYRDDPCWVPPLLRDVENVFRSARNPFFEHGEIEAYLARRNEGVVGRIAAIRNRAHETFHGEAAGFFGFFECESDPETAMGLLGSVREFLRQRKLAVLRGPVNPSTNDECGLLVDGFDTPPMILMAHTLPYYPALLEQCGLTKAKDLFAYLLEADTEPDKLRRGAALARERNPEVVIRPLDKRKLDREVAAFKSVYNKAWEKNWGFVPMTDAEVDHMARQLKPAVDPALVQFAERRGETVGFALGLPDMNVALKHANGRLFPFGFLKVLWHARRIHRARILALGILPEYRRSGIDVLLYDELFRRGLARGYRVGEFSWILEDNLAMRRPLEGIGARPYKTYRIYEAPVDPSR